MSEAGSSEVVTRRVDRAGRLTLNRPEALNSVTLGMVRAIQQALDEWRDDPSVELVILDGAGDRALAAGGDVRALYDSHTEGPEFHQTFWREEYVLDACIARYPKPFIAAMDGIVMGGGIGVSAHASYRIVTERSRLAMPETGIGLIPDVGGTFLLSRAPGETGTYLGLTGHPMNAGDAIFAKFADYYVPSDELPAVLSRIAEEGLSELTTLLSNAARVPLVPGLETRQDIIDGTFRFDSVERIFDALERNENDWAEETLEGLVKRSPTSLKATLAAVRRARTICSLEEALNWEYRYVCRLFECGEFLEGIRALVVDKDRAPKWTPASLQGVSDDMVRQLSAPMDTELGLPVPARD